MTRTAPMARPAPGALSMLDWACQCTPLGARSSTEHPGLTRGKEQLLPESNTINNLMLSQLHIFSNDHFQIGDLMKKDPFTVYDYAGYTVGSGEIRVDFGIINVKSI